jgi:hypothetical protein
MRLARFAALLLVLPSLLAAQQKVLQRCAVEPLPSNLRFEMPEGTEEVSIPFRTFNSHVLLPVKVNGKGPFQIILDTGMPVEDLLLHGSKRVESLRLNYLEGVQAVIAGVGGDGAGVPARTADGIMLEIGDLKILDSRATVMPAPPGFGAYHDGVIGAALFQHFAVSLDNDRGILTLRRLEAFRPPDGAAVVPMNLEHGMPFLEANVRIAEGDPVPVHLVVDLGASHAVSLNKADEKGIRAPAGSVATSIGRGVSGMLTGRVGRIRSLEIGDRTLEHVVATFPESEHRTPAGTFLGDGNLGNGALGRFNLTFDYAGKRIVLEPSRRFSDPFEWDMSGIQAEPTGEGTVRVRQVLVGSPADEAGVREDDRIVRIAGEKVTETTYFSLRDRLRKEGETVVVELRRGDRPVKVSLKLRRLI